MGGKQKKHPSSKAPAKKNTSTKKKTNNTPKNKNVSSANATKHETPKKVSHTEDVKSEKEEVLAKKAATSDKTLTKESKGNKKGTPSKKEETKEIDGGTPVIIKVAVFVIIAVIIVLLLLKACNNKERYTVKFDANGGTSIAEQIIDANGKLVKPADPTREGYIFEGWYIGDEEFNFDREVTSDMTIEARWKAVDKVELKGLSIAKELSLKPGETAILEPEFDPSDATDVELVFSSDNEDVVVVDNDGNVEALKNGEATITVKTKDGKFSAKCKVKVSDKATSVTSITLAKHDVTISEGQELTLEYTIKPSNASNKNVTWKSSDKSIVTVDKNGRIKGVKAGTARVTVTSSNGKTDTIVVRVKEKQSTKVDVSSIKITGKSSGSVGDKIKLTATVSPSKATDKNVTWSTSDDDIATVDQKGNVTLKKAGTVTIYAKSANGVTAKHTIKVSDKYVLTLTALVGVNGDIAQYEVSVTRNGSNFTDYTSITLSDGFKIMKDNKTIQHGQFDQSKITGATVRLKDGSTNTNVTIKWASKSRE